jgi:hypothetical protein
VAGRGCPSTHYRFGVTSLERGLVAADDITGVSQQLDHGTAADTRGAVRYCPTGSV